MEIELYNNLSFLIDQDESDDEITTFVVPRYDDVKFSILTRDRTEILPYYMEVIEDKVMYKFRVKTNLISNFPEEITRSLGNYSIRYKCYHNGKTIYIRYLKQQTNNTDEFLIPEGYKVIISKNYVDDEEYNNFIKRYKPKEVSICGTQTKIVQDCIDFSEVEVLSFQQTFDDSRLNFLYVVGLCNPKKLKVFSISTNSNFDEELISLITDRGLTFEFNGVTFYLENGKIHANINNSYIAEEQFEYITKRKQSGDIGTVGMVYRFIHSTKALDCVLRARHSDVERILISSAYSVDALQFTPGKGNEQYNDMKIMSTKKSAKKVV